MAYARRRAPARSGYRPARRAPARRAPARRRSTGRRPAANVMRLVIETVPASGVARDFAPTVQRPLPKKAKL